MTKKKQDWRDVAWPYEEQDWRDVAWPEGEKTTEVRIRTVGALYDHLVECQDCRRDFANEEGMYIVDDEGETMSDKEGVEKVLGTLPEEFATLYVTTKLEGSKE